MVIKSLGPVQEMRARGVTEQEIAAHYSLEAGGRDVEQDLFRRIKAGCELAITELWLRQQATIIYYYTSRLQKINQRPQTRPELFASLLDESHAAFYKAVNSYRPDNARRHSFNMWIRFYLSHVWKAHVSKEHWRLPQPLEVDPTVDRLDPVGPSIEEQRYHEEIHADPQLERVADALGQGWPDSKIQREYRIPKAELKAAKARILELYS